VSWFHSGGIFAALSETTGELIIEAMRAARAVGAVVSFDLNYRQKLWNIWGGREQAVAICRRIVENVDVLVGNEEDLQQALGIPGPEIGREWALDSSAFVAMIKDVLDAYPQVKVIGATLRDVASASHHRWGAVASIDGEIYQSPICDLDVLDRIGGGDGFASGLFYGLLAGEDPQAAVDLGWAHGALLTTFPGDTTMATLQQVRELARGGSARVQR
jgi:2-dehydro-3-deoxygluconokinase